MIDVYNANLGGNRLDDDPCHISWTHRLKGYAEKGNRIDFADSSIVLSAYRPFCKQWLYYSKELNERTYQQPRLFPLNSKIQSNGSPAALENLVIQTAGVASSSFSCLIADCVPCYDRLSKGQCFPLYWYEEKEQFGGLFGDELDGYTRHDAIADETLAVFRAAYPHAFGLVNRRSIEQAKADGLSNKAATSEERFEIAKVDIFYYIYGILHSPEYRKRFEANLKKELPRIPLAADFVAFARAGRALADLHLNYETVERWAAIEEEGDSANPGRTVKMAFGKCKKDDHHPKGQDMSVIKVAENLTLRNIPLEAYDYVVNGRSAIGWLMDRYQVRTDKASGIMNDPNDYSDDPRYIVDLVKRVVTVSLSTLEIVHTLPSLNEKPQPADWPLTWKMG